MIVKVKSKYGSLVAVRDKYIKKCKKEFEFIDSKQIQQFAEQAKTKYPLDQK